jgi:hypothetical protein
VSKTPTDPGVASCAADYRYTPPTPPGGPRFTVTKYGARGNGVTNSSPGISAAITAAQAHGGVVYIPAGKYLIKSTIFVPEGRGVTITGESRTATSLMAGAPGQTMLKIQADHTTVENMTLSAQIDGGSPAITSGASYVWLLHLEVLGSSGGSWPIRLAGGKGSTPGHASYATGNVVDDVILHDTAPQRNDGLGFAFQSNAVVANLVHYGSRIGLYIDKNVTVFNDHFTPNTLNNGGEKGYVITTPSSNIVISHFVTSGAGGKIAAVPVAKKRGGSSDVTVCGEQMTGSSTNVLFIGDVTGLTISDSHLETVQLAPNVELQGIMTGTTYKSLKRKKSGTARVDLVTK